jgi:hypothetical protein
VASDDERTQVETQGVPTGRRRPGLLFAAIRERFLGRGPGVLCFVLARAHHALARWTVRICDAFVIGPSEIRKSSLCSR